MIRHLISSEPSDRPSKREPSDERAKGVEDLAERECDDADRMGSSVVVADRDGVGDDPDLASASSASIVRVDSCSSGYRDFDATRATPGEKDGGGFTGVPSPGDVMDIGCFLRTWG